jgi:hypothetical protein
LLRVGQAALKTAWIASSVEMLIYTRKLRFLDGFIRWRSPFGPAVGCYSRWSLRLACL